MKTLFLISMAIQFLIQTTVGTITAVAPRSVLPDVAMSEIYQLRAQGFVALTIGVATVMLWYRRDNFAVVSFATAFFAIYHTMVTIGGLWNATLGYDFSPITVHLVMGILFWILWFKRDSLRPATTGVSGA